ncbi:MAG: transglutaminase domain-containing protein [Candidatus Zixiibacteriota bacterium]
MKRYFGIFLLSLLYILIAFMVYYLVPVSVYYTITETYTIEKIPIGEKLRIGLILPSENPYQTISEPEIEWDGEYRLSDRGDCQLCYLSAHSRDERRYRARVKYKAILRQGKIKWQDEVKFEDTKAKPNIESNRQPIKVKADEIESEPGDFEFIDIFHFVQRHITKYSDTTFSALQSIETGHASSISASNLAVAIARSKNIPARQMTGRRLNISFFLFPSKDTKYPGSRRGWCEFYQDSIWHFCDPLKVTVFTKFGYDRLDGTYLAFASNNDLIAYHQNIYSWAKSQGKEIHIADSSWRTAAGTTSDDIKIDSEIKINKSIDLRWIIIFLIFISIAMLRSIIKLRKIRNQHRDHLKSLVNDVM